MRIVLCAVLLLISTHVSAGARDRAALIGTWYIQYNNPKIGPMAGTITYADDGTFKGFVEKNGKRHWTFAGRWVLSGPWLSYTYIESDLEKVPPGSTDRDKLIKVTETELVVNDSEKTERTYVRKSESSEAQQGTPADPPRPAGSAGG